MVPTYLQAGGTVRYSGEAGGAEQRVGSRARGREVDGKGRREGCGRAGRPGHPSPLAHTLMPARSAPTHYPAPPPPPPPPPHRQIDNRPPHLLHHSFLARPEEQRKPQPQPQPPSPSPRRRRGPCGGRNRHSHGSTSPPASCTCAGCGQAGGQRRGGGRAGATWGSARRRDRACVRGRGKAAVGGERDACPPTGRTAAPHPPSSSSLPGGAAGVAVPSRQGGRACDPPPLPN